MAATLLAAQSVVLGENPGDFVDFLRITANTSGLFELHEDGVIVVTGDNEWGAGRLDGIAIIDGLTSNIVVEGDLVMSASLIRLGEHGTDTESHSLVEGWESDSRRYRRCPYHSQRRA